MKKKNLLGLAGVLFLVLTGCAPTVAEARTTFCQNLAAYGQAMNALQSVNASTTVDELNEARETAAEARQAILDSASNLREAKLESAEDAWEALEDTVQSMSGNDTLGEVALTVRAQTGVLNAEIARLNNVICTSR